MSLLEWSQLATIIGSFGSIATGIGTLIVLFLSLKLSKRSILLAHQSKRADILSECNSRFSRIMEMRSNPEVIANPKYFFERFWTLQFDQYTFWRMGFVDDDVFEYWMENRYINWKQNLFFGDMHYQDGYKSIVETLRQPRFRKFMDELHEQGTKMIAESSERVMLLSRHMKSRRRQGQTNFERL
jgi:hypothetical protein